jgi:hypothetical protein
LSVRGVCFWASAAGAAWVLVGYPASLLLRRERPWSRGDDLPSVTILIPAYRERDTLPRKLAELRNLDYPGDRLDVVVMVDEDSELVGIARAAHPEASVIFSPDRGGKSAALSRGLTTARGDIVVMTDANNVLERGSVRAAARHFADAEVWGVAGRRGEAGSAYDRYESLIRSLESRSGSVAAMSGEFMAVRRDRIPAIPEHVVNDDFWLLCHLVRKGGRAVYEPAAASSEEALPPEAEIARRSRMGAGRVMALSELKGLPTDFALRVLSHKFGRLALPFLLLTALLSSLSLAGRRPYRGIAIAQAAVYASGVLASAGLSPPGPLGRLTRAAGQFLLGNVAIAVGVVRGLRRRQSVRWEPVR